MTEMIMGGPCKCCGCMVFRQTKDRYAPGQCACNRMIAEHAEVASWTGAMEQVLAALDETEGLHGPDDDEYDELMTRVADEAFKRRDAHRQRVAAERAEVQAKMEAERKETERKIVAKSHQWDAVINEYTTKIEAAVYYDDVHDLASVVTALQLVTAKMQRKLVEVVLIEGKCIR